MRILQRLAVLALVVATLVVVPAQSTLAAPGEAMPSTQQNLLRNPGFEGSYSQFAHYATAIMAPEWLPWFSCDAIGEEILSCADRHRETTFLAFCGHTHSPGRYSPRPNVHVETAAAEYGHPAVQAVIELEGAPSSGGPEESR